MNSILSSHRFRELIGVIGVALAYLVLVECINAGELKVVGPSGGVPGDIILLTAQVDGSPAVASHRFAWSVIPPVTASGKPTSLKISDDKIIVASIPGRYSIVCAAGNADEVLQSLWVVEIEGTPQPGPGPTPGPEPGPGPSPDLTPLGKLAYEWTRAVNRSAEEKRAFAAAYRQTASTIDSSVAAGVTMTPEQCVKLLAEEVGAIATPAFRDAWGEWSAKYKAEMQRLRLTTAAQHATAWREIAAGLEAASGP